MRNLIRLCLPALALVMGQAHAAILTFNSTGTDITATRDAWLTAAGVSAPQFIVDFETGFTDGQNVSGQGGLFPGGLVITDTSSAGSATIEADAGGIGGSNPIGGFALEHNEAQFLVLDFTASPVDYVAFRDIDHTMADINVFFVGGGSSSFDIETTGASGNSAEFVGIVSNDMPLITRLEIDASGDRRWGVDNIEYGVAAVPLPAAAWLFASALMGLGLLQRRSR